MAFYQVMVFKVPFEVPEIFGHDCLCLGFEICFRHVKKYTFLTFSRESLVILDCINDAIYMHQMSSQSTTKCLV